MSDSQVATPMARLGAHLLEMVLSVVTLGIGWLIWSFIVWGKGTTPAHQILKQYVVDSKTGETFSWGKMFLREFVIKGILTGLLTAVSFGIYYLVDGLFIIKEGNQTVHDRICSSSVVQR